ncbi:uncharacterized protein METZ01_LOCUS198203 [marine metagenome]|jgi:hypothetical protein|uniref:Uncharacterized protein n=1 Tax=marine metagenome TaxID=408172 RepID=A0A382E4L7_9ZZZZ
MDKILSVLTLFLLADEEGDFIKIIGENDHGNLLYVR